MPKLNPIYYQEKAVKLYARDRKIGKILKKKKVNKHGEDDDDEEEEEEEDDNDDSHYNTNNLGDSMGNANFMSGTGPSIDATGTNQYRKKHFTKLFTPHHPGLSNQLMKKLNGTS